VKSNSLHLQIHFSSSIAAKPVVQLTHPGHVYNKFEQRHHMSGRATKLEILGACNASDTTPSEGPNTFTKRLTKYLGSIQHSTSVYNTDDIHTHLYKKHRKGQLDVEPFRINLTPNLILIVLEPTWSSW